MSNEALTEKQVSERYNISENTLRAHRYQKRGIPYVKIGKCVRYRVSDIEAYMNQHKVTPAV